jgi:choline dehydrogenase-like flavoprotein
MQFRDPPERGKVGGIKIEFSELTFGRLKVKKWVGAQEIVKQRESLRNMRQIHFHSESQASADNFVGLSGETDRFGDPLAHVHYESSDFNEATYRFASRLFDRFSAALGPADTWFPKLQGFDSGCHHLGSCRMGSSVGDSVVDQFGRLHEVDNVYVVGGSMFAGTPGVVNPTLTIAALAVRCAEHLADQMR